MFSLGKNELKMKFVVYIRKWGFGMDVNGIGAVLIGKVHMIGIDLQ